MNILRKGKNQINVLKEENKKFEMFLDNIRKLFPKNYFLQKTKRENIKRYNQGDALFVCGSRRMQINVIVSEEELESFGAGGGF